MRTQSSKQRINPVAVQPQTTSRKGDCVNKRNSTTLQLAIVVAMVIAMALSAGAQTVYMVTQDNICENNPACDTNTLVSFTLPATGGQFTATPIGLTAEIRGLVFDNYNGTLYGITAQGIFVSVNKSSGVTTPLLTLPYWPQGSPQNEWSGMASNGQNDLYVVNAFGNNELVDINISNSGSPTQTLIGSTVFTTSGGLREPQQILGLAYSASGVLYGSDRTIDNVVTISTQDASVSLPYPYTAGINNLQEIGFDPSGKLYTVYDHVATSNNAGFASYNFTTGSATELGELPFQIDFNGCCGNATYGAGGFAFLSACIAPPSNMVAWYPLDPPGNVTNTAQPDLANNNTGTSFGNPAALSIAGKVSGGLSFNGTNDYVKAPDQAALDIVASQDLSFDAWVKLSSTTSGVVSLVDKRQGSPLRGYQFFLYNGKLGVQLADGLGSNGYDNYVSTTAVPANNQWHLVAMTVQRSSTTCGSSCGTWYLDGNSVGNFDPTAHPGSLSSPGIPLMIGAQGPSVGLGEFFSGGLDEVELFNRALNPTEVSALYQAGSAGKCK
ncbi:MAG: LamG-like jellyroll fold domain-containing protein [Candidatus Korobacteraceae bacterium]